MILNLIIKDIRAYGKSLLKLTLLSLIVITAFSVIYKQSWIIYIVMAAGQISFIIGYFLTSEKMRRGEMLVCSLPVTRNSIIQGRYLAASLIAILGVILWFLYACFLNSIFSSAPGDFHLFTNPIILFFVVFYFSFFISVFFPIVTIFDKIWALTNLSIIFAALFIVPFTLFYEAKGLLFSESKTGDILFINIIILISVLMLYISMRISLRLYNRREL